MKLWVDALNIRQRDWLVQELFVERKREASVQTMSMENSDAQNPSDKVKVGKMIGIDT
jgi:hypothetical protein